MQLSKLILAVVTLSLAAPLLSYADENIIVYGVRLDQPKTEVGSSVSILTADEIDAMGIEFVVDAIAAMPGVTINQNGPYGGAATVRIRGASSEQTLVIIDGVVANDPSSPGGGFDFSRLEPTNIERIEVLKGPQSTLWGTDAIGGVVNIITKRSTEAFEGNVFAQVGSFNSLRGGAAVAGAGDVIDYRLSASQTSSDGISRADKISGNTEKDGYESTVVSAKIGAQFSEQMSARLSVMWTDAETQFDSFVFGEQGNVGDGDELSLTEELVANLTLTAALFDGRLNNMLLIGYSDIDRENFTDGAAGFASKGNRKTYRYQGNLAFNERSRIAFGAEREESESNGEDASIDGLFALYELQPTEMVTLTAGFRRDDHDVFGGETTGRFAAAFNPTNQITLRASWGEGFKAPTLFQTTFFCCGATAPNTDLKPEVSEAIDFGVTYRTANSRGEVGVTYFDQDTTNLITFSFGIGGYENIAQARSKGVEIVASYQFVEWFDASLSFADIDATDGAGDTLVRVPDQTADLRFTFSPDGPWSANVLMRYNGEETDSNGPVPSWTRTDLAGKFKVSESVELFARIENVFDKQYQQILGYGTAGTSGYLGARLSF